MSRITKQLSDERVVIDTLRLSDADWYECVSEMDRMSAQGRVGHERRSQERLPYRNSPQIMIEMTLYDGRRQYCRVRPYDLSESGIGFLNGAYMHVETEIILHLRHREIGITKIDATIRHCSYVKNKIHLVGAEFNEPIVLDDFLLAESS